MKKEMLLMPCDFKTCEALCCYDGVYLMSGEEEFLLQLIGRFPEQFSDIQGDIFVDGYWMDELFGRKINTRPHQYKSSNFPAHFSPTRCVMADEAGLCRLEKFAIELNLHPWSFKPATCWLFPLNIENGDPVPPPLDPKDDPNYVDDKYPGFVCYVPCGQYSSKGKPWKDVLKRELSYFRGTKSLPLLGCPGHTLDEIVAGRGKIQE